MPYPYIDILFNDSPTPEIYTLSLHDALPICRSARRHVRNDLRGRTRAQRHAGQAVVVLARRCTLSVGTLLRADRKSTRLNSSHANISYAVFCLKKKNDVVFLEDPSSGGVLGF